MLLTPAQIKPKLFESRQNSFLSGVDASHVYMCALVLGCFYGQISTQTFQRALTTSLDSCAGIKSAPSVAFITKSGRVWRKVPENNAQCEVINVND